MTLNIQTWTGHAYMSGIVKTIAGSIVCLGLLAPQQAAANSKYAAFVYDVNTGKTLFSRHADKRRFPASLTKMMTLYVLFEEIQAGRYNLGSRLKISRTAASRPPSKLGLRPGSTITVKSAILSLVTKSANDIAAAIAENISGSEANFGKRMTRTARKLGMKSTTFRNASGLPNSKQHTTARDMMRLGLALQKNFPSYYRYFNTTSFKYAGRSYRNHNRLLRRVKGVDGIKTGYTRASGFNLVANVRTGNRHIIAVVMGGKTGRSRDAHMRQLIARYLPKAKRRRGGSALIASAASAPVVLANVPQPIVKPTLAGAKSTAPDQAVQIAAAVRKSYAKIPPKPVVTAAYVPESQTRKVVEPMPTVAIARIDAVASKPDGWLIQIGAVPNKTMALELLGSAKDQAKRTLKNTAPFTETVKKGGQTLHRARFAGFDNKASARRACVILKRKKFPCLALPPQ